MRRRLKTFCFVTSLERGVRIMAILGIAGGFMGLVGTSSKTDANSYLRKVSPVAVIMSSVSVLYGVE